MPDVVDSEKPFETMWKWFAARRPRDAADLDGGTPLRSPRSPAHGRPRRGRGASRGLVRAPMPGSWASGPARLAMMFVTALLVAGAGATRAAPCGGASSTAEVPAYAVGERAIVLVDPSRPTPAFEDYPGEGTRTLATVVWYPAEGAPGTAAAGAPLAAGGPFPLVLHSHGYGDLNVGQDYLGKALASRGFVVAAPLFPRVNLGVVGRKDLADLANHPFDVHFVLATLLAGDRDDTAFLAGGVDEKRIGLSGLSMGGFTTLAAAYHPTLRDPRVRAVAVLAPAACALRPALYQGAHTPLLVVNGDRDYITPLERDAARAFARARGPRQLVVLAGATHTAFSGLIGDAPPDANYDVAIGCPFVEDITLADIERTVAATGGFGTGFIDFGPCALPCSGEPPSGDVMAAARQREITTAAVTAFFSWRLQRSKSARCIVRHGLAANAPEVSVRSHGRGKARADHAGGGRSRH